MPITSYENLFDSNLELTSISQGVSRHTLARGLAWRQALGVLKGGIDPQHTNTERFIDEIRSGFGPLFGGILDNAKPTVRLAAYGDKAPAVMSAVSFIRLAGDRIAAIPEFADSIALAQKTSARCMDISLFSGLGSGAISILCAPLVIHSVPLDIMSALAVAAAAVLAIPQNARLKTENAFGHLVTLAAQSGLRTWCDTVPMGAAYRIAVEKNDGYDNTDVRIPYPEITDIARASRAEISEFVQCNKWDGRFTFKIVPEENGGFLAGTALAIDMDFTRPPDWSRPAIGNFKGAVASP